MTTIYSLFTALAEVYISPALSALLLNDSLLCLLQHRTWLQVHDACMSSLHSLDKQDRLPQSAIDNIIASMRSKLMASVVWDKVVVQVDVLCCEPVCLCITVMQQMCCLAWPEQMDVLAGKGDHFEKVALHGIRSQGFKGNACGHVVV